MSCCLGCRVETVETLVDFGPQAIGHHFFDGGQSEGTYPIRFGICGACGLAQLIEPIPAEQLIPRVDWITYNEPEAHLDLMVDMLRGLPGIGRDSTIAGVTYKDDTTLRRFRERGYARTWRCDPASDLGIEEQRAGVETIVARIQAPLVPHLHARHGVPDAVIVRHILEHTLATGKFLEAFRRMVRPGGYVVFEVPECVRGFNLLDYTTLWEDHSLYFVEPTFVGTLERNGFNVVRFVRYSAAYENCLVAVTQSAAVVEPSLVPAVVLQCEIARARAFAEGFAGHRAALRRELETWRERGRIFMFGAGHQSVTFLNLMGVADLIAGVIDDSPRKCGLRMPGSRTPIVGSHVLAEPDVKLCLLSLGAESEKKVVSKQAAFVERGGTFASIYPLVRGELLNFAAGATAIA